MSEILARAAYPCADLCSDNAVLLASKANASAIGEARWSYAREVCAVAGAESETLLEALACVPREATLGAPPWQVLGRSFNKQPPPTALLHDVLHNVAVALPTGAVQPEPALLALLLHRLSICRGEKVVAIGHGVAYAAALASHLAATATQSIELADTNDAISATTSEPPGPVDAMLLLAGCSRPPWPWLNQLAPGGRAVFALRGAEGMALYWLLQRPLVGQRWSAQSFMLAETAPWKEFWDANEAALADSIAHQLAQVTCLLPQASDGEDMLLVFDEGCLSRRDMPT